LLVSLLLFLASMAVTNIWWPGALAYAASGVGIGVVLGIAGLWLSRFEATPQGMFYTPNPWLVLSLTLLVAGRIAMGFVELWRHWQGRESLALIPVLDHASLFAVAGLLQAGVRSEFVNDLDHAFRLLRNQFNDAMDAAYGLIVGCFHLDIMQAGGCIVRQSGGT
jgi:hypothetical protein